MSKPIIVIEFEDVFCPMYSYTGTIHSVDEDLLLFVRELKERDLSWILYTKNMKDAEKFCAYYELYPINIVDNVNKNNNVLFIDLRSYTKTPLRFNLNRIISGMFDEEPTETTLTVNDMPVHDTTNVDIDEGEI